MTSRLWRRLRRNAGSVLAVLARGALRPKNLLGLFGAAVALGAVGHAVGAVTAGHLVVAGGALVVTAGASSAALWSFLGDPRRGAVALLATLVLVAGVGHAVGGLTAGGSAEDADREAVVVTVDGPQGERTPVDTNQALGEERAPGPGEIPDHAGGEYRCSDYTYQETAQVIYEEIPAAGELDGDGDGFACEHLPSSGLSYPDH